MRLHILSPSDFGNPKVAQLWQDYWIKKDLEREFGRLGYEIVQHNGAIDLFLFGTWSPHEKLMNAPKRFCWFISHPRLLAEPKWQDFNKQFIHIWALSHNLYNSFPEDIKERSSVLMGATSKQYVPRNKKPEYDIVLMGNASKPTRVKAVKHLIALRRHKIMIAGGGWNKKLTEDEMNFIKWIPYFPNDQYFEFYNNGYVTFFASHPDLVRYGMVPQRVYDIFACSDCLCICENTHGLKRLSLHIPSFETIDELIVKIDYYIKNQEEAMFLSKKSRDDVNQHPFALVASQMHEKMRLCK